MNVLFVHQNFPGQYKHLMPYFVNAGHKVIAIGEEKNLQSNTFPSHMDIRSYPLPQGASNTTHHYIRNFEEHIRRGQAALRLCIDIRAEGFIPDLIFVHPGWGEGLFLRDIFPHAKIIAFCEYFYDKHHLGNIEEEEYSMTFDALLRFRAQNSTQLLSATAWDWGIAPTYFQWRTYPDFLRSKISVIHDGIDTTTIKPNPTPQPITLPDGRKLAKGKDCIITYVSRSLEPYRGFNYFMQAIPHIQKALPNAHIVLIGADNTVSYGREAPNGKTYREIYTEKIQHATNFDNVHFLGRLGYNDFQNVLHNTSVHTYLSYPFVLSWSIIEAMAMELLIVASDTKSVTEVIHHYETGIVCDFYSPEDIAQKIVEAYTLPEETKERLRTNARKLVLEKYDLRTRCLPKQLELCNILLAGGIPKAPELL